jgi:carboxyl-terminal processing protease
LVLGGILLGSALTGGRAGAAGEDPLAAVRTAFEVLLQDFAGRVDPQALVAGAIRGMVQALHDPFTDYLPPEQDRSLTDTLNGFAGVGLVIQPLGQGDVIQSVLAGGPAQQAGLRAGDLIVAVDGRPTAGQPLDQVVAEIRGAPGTQVTLDVLEPGRQQPVRVTLTRVAIRQPTVFASSPAPGVGLIRITEFSSTTAEEFDRALAELRAQPGGLKGLVLDLRGNPGGYVDAALRVVGALAPAGPLLVVVDRDGRRTTYSAPDHPPAPPTVVLVDGTTASAAEIVAGALQYRQAAVLVGSRTYGKGSVQQLFDLPGGGALKVTVSHDELPDGTSWDGRGLEPDVQASPVPSPLDGLPAFAPVGQRDLREGMIGLDVYGLQQRLQLLGYYGRDPDGVYDAYTAAAVQLFQRDRGRPATGAVGAADWEALGRAVAARIDALRSAPRPDTVLQTGLEVLGRMMGSG